MLLEIRGHHLPGRSWHDGAERHDRVHVGIQIGREPRELVPADTATASWTVDIEPSARDDGTDFRGAAVQGKRGAWFIYLTWGDIGEDGTFTIFRRAKLMLDDIKPLITGDHGQTIVATVDLTDDCGGPRCARLREPALRLA